MADAPITTLDEFRAACQRHDLTHGMSDSAAVYRAGSIDRRRIAAAAMHFPRADVVRIWNEVVDSKLVPGAREMFYWK